MIKSILTIVVIAVVAFFGFRYFKNTEVETPVPTEEKPAKNEGFNAKANIWNRPVTELGLGINKLGGYLELSPDESYLMFGGVFEEGTRFDNMIFIADLSDGRVWEIPGSPLGLWSSSNMLASVENDKIFITRLSDGKVDSYADANMTFTGFFSPDEKKFAYNTNKGIRVIDLGAKTISTISDKQYDGAYAWYSDSKRILGYQENSIDNLYEAGRGRILAIWDTQTKTADTNLGIDMPSSTLRFAEWIEPEKIARVNAGFDDGSFDYIVDVPNKFVADIGETSGMLMGGVELDQELKLIAMVGEEIDGPGEMEPLSVAKIVDQNGKTLQRRAFDDNFSREYVQVISPTKIMYLRKGSFENQKTEVIHLDFNDGVEKVIYIEDAWLNNLKVTKDKKHWILAGQNSIIMKDI